MKSALRLFLTFRDLLPDRRGVAALEFALIAPMYLLLLLGIVAYGLYCTAQIAVTVAATEGARAAVGMLSGSTTYSPVNQAKATACTVLNSYAPLLTCNASNPAASGITATQTGTQVTVTVTYAYAGGNITSLVPVPTSAPTYTAIATVSAY